MGWNGHADFPVFFSGGNVLWHLQNPVVFKIRGTRDEPNQSKPNRGILEVPKKPRDSMSAEQTAGLW